MPPSQTPRAQLNGQEITQSGPNANRSGRKTSKSVTRDGTSRGAKQRNEHKGTWSKRQTQGSTRYPKHKGARDIRNEHGLTMRQLRQQKVHTNEDASGRLHLSARRYKKRPHFFQRGHFGWQLKDGADSQKPSLQPALCAESQDSRAGACQPATGIFCRRFSCWSSRTI